MLLRCCVDKKLVGEEMEAGRVWWYWYAAVGKAAGRKGQIDYFCLVVR
jgi:hypothetical protein